MEFSLEFVPAVLDENVFQTRRSHSFEILAYYFGRASYRAGTGRDFIPESLLPAGTRYHSILGVSKDRKYVASVCLSIFGTRVHRKGTKM